MTRKAGLIGLTLATALLLSSCATQKIGIADYTGFTELPFPNNSFAPGQIVEVYSEPRKVEITYDPGIPWDMRNTSPGWDISGNETSKLEGSLSAQIASILQGTAGISSTSQVKVEFTNTKSILVPKNVIFKKLYESINSDKFLRMQLESYSENGTDFYAVTAVLSADVSFKLVGTNSMDASAETEVIEKLKAQFGSTFRVESGSDRFISGQNLIVGLHYDPEMIALIIAEKQKT